MNKSLSDLERRIAESVPRIDPALRDEALFQAGRAIGRRGSRRQLVAVSAAASSILSAISLFLLISFGIVTFHTPDLQVGRHSVAPGTVAGAAARIVLDPGDVPLSDGNVLSAVGRRQAPLEPHRFAHEDPTSLQLRRSGEPDANVLMAGRIPASWDF